MANTGMTLPAGAANNADAGNTAWSNPTNALTDNGARASLFLKSGNTTQYLHLTSFGFALPAGATVDGVIARVQRSNGATTTQHCTDHTIQLIVGGSRSGDNKAAPGNWPINSADANADYGGVSDSWGLSLGAADVNASSFGLAVRASGVGSPISQPQVDVVWLDVYYTEAPAGGGPPVKMHSYRQRRI